MSVSDIVANWRPGSGDWPWGVEFASLMKRPETHAIAERVRDEGIGFIDYHSPVMLGSDGRVWDGHHRICIALRDNITHLNVEIVEASE